MFSNKARQVVSSVASVPLPEGGGNSNSGGVDGQASYLHFCWAEIKGANFGVPVLMWGHKLLSGRFLNSFRRIPQSSSRGEMLLGHAAGWLEKGVYQAEPAGRSSFTISTSASSPILCTLAHSKTLCNDKVVTWQPSSYTHSEPWPLIREFIG